MEGLWNIGRVHWSLGTDVVRTTWYDMMYFSTAIGLTLGGSGTVHIYTQTIPRTTQITTNLEECGPCPFFVSFTLAFALQLRKKHGKTPVRLDCWTLAMKALCSSGNRWLSAYKAQHPKGIATKSVWEGTYPEISVHNMNLLAHGHDWMWQIAPQQLNTVTDGFFFIIGLPKKLVQA
jgi:hypothetical protein